MSNEIEIANQYKLPRITVRKAYERLGELGYVYKKQGKGSYVLDRNKQPIALHISWVAESVFQDVDAVGMDITSMFNYYRRKGYREFLSKPRALSVSFPTESQRDLLNCTSLIPLLVLESGCTDKKSGTVLEHTRILYRSDCFSYVIP